MIDLTVYILEKFKISRETKSVPYSFKQGDIMLRVCFYNYKSSGDSYFEIGGSRGNCFGFGSRDEKRFYFSQTANPSDYNDFYSSEDSYFINDKLHYEINTVNKEETKLNCLYLDRESALELLKELLPVYPKPTSSIESDGVEEDKINSILKKYFDESTKLPDKYLIRRSHRKNTIENIYKYLQEHDKLK